MKVKVDENLCIGCQACVETCPDIFKMEDDIAVAYQNNDPVPADMEDCAKNGAEICPVDAIPIEE